MEHDFPPRILVGVHGSAASVAALRWAVREAGLRGARLHVVQAWEHPASSAAPYAPHAQRVPRQDVLAAAAAQLQQAVQDTLGSPPAVPASVDLAEGLAARVLLDRAAGAEFLVLGSASAERDCIGPVARVCLARAPCPVVIITAAVARVPVSA